MASLQRRANNRWYAVFDLGRGPDGKRIRKWRPLEARSKRAAEAEMHTLEQSLDSAGAPSAQATLREWLELWLAHCRSTVSAKTLEGYRSQIERFINPYLGNVQLQKLQTIHVDRWLAVLRTQPRSRPLAESSILRFYSVLSAALRFAVTRGIIPKNPMIAAQRPKAQRATSAASSALNDAEVKALLHALIDQPIRLPVLLAVALGLRRGEVCALRWNDVDLEAGSIVVRASVSELRGQHELKSTKSGRERVLPIPAFVKSELLRQRARQAEWKLQLGSSYDPGRWVCSWEDGRMMLPGYLTHRFGDLLQKLNLRQIRFHDLRHSCAALLLRQGTPMPVIRQILGHASITTTIDIYGHVDRKLHERAAAAMDDVLGEGSS